MRIRGIYKRVGGVFMEVDKQFIDIFFKYQESMMQHLKDITKNQIIILDTLGHVLDALKKLNKNESN